MGQNKASALNDCGILRDDTPTMKAMTPVDIEKANPITRIAQEAEPLERQLAWLYQRRQGVQCAIEVLSRYVDGVDVASAKGCRSRWPPRRACRRAYRD